MAGRWRDVDLNHGVARGRGALARPSDSLLDRRARPRLRVDLGGDGWHGTMNYAGFMRPVWIWLRGDEPPRELRHVLGRAGRPCRASTARDAVATMRAFRAGLPVAVGAALVGAARQPRHAALPHRGRLARAARVGIGLQMTTPGRADGLRRRRARPRGRVGRGRAADDALGPARDAGTRTSSRTYRRLIALRRSSDALARGGIRYAHVGADAIAYLRETRRERLLCLARARVARAGRGCRSTRSALPRSSRCTAGRPSRRGDSDAPLGRPRVPRLEAT